MPPEVWPETVGAKLTATEHVAPGASVTPVAQFVVTCQPAPVAGSTETSVKDHDWLPQLLTVTVAVDTVPTSRLPKSSVPSVAQKRPCAAAPDAMAKHTKARRIRVVLSPS
ncbi:MAG: hypothetical protein E6H78_03665 [Betaproteobacteria bacterium]|nr:MAG: hypothetical protein E6H78_03665 [Betaproteobacteria bacterium]